jgi:hypothetical protein
MGMPIGVTKTAPFNAPNPAPDGSYADATGIYANFSNSGATYSSAPNSVELWRSALSGRPAGSVTIIAGGTLTTMDSFLTSYPALLSAVDRLAIIATTAIAGSPYNGSEANASNDRPASNRVFANWPTTIELHPVELANSISQSAPIMVGGPMYAAFTDADPTRYGCHNSGTFDTTNGRPGWFQLVILAAACAGRGPLTYTQGTMVVNSSTGLCAWTPGAGTHYLASPAAADGTYKSILNAIQSLSRTGMTGYSAVKGANAIFLI